VFLEAKGDGLSFLSIDADESTWLEREFEENEVWDVVRDLNGDKAPGLDGFTMVFFKKCWEILKKDLMVVFAEFHSKGQFEKSLSATFVSLIPKKTCAVDVKDFCPISLVVGGGGVYKIISKVYWAKFSPTNIMHSLEVDKFWIQCLLLMNVWIVNFNRGNLGCCASWI
jgi:hypothetical protein